MSVSALQPLKNLYASHNRALAREGLSFELSRVILQGWLYLMMIIWIIHMWSRRPRKRMGVFTGEGTSLCKKFREWASYSVTKLHFSVRVCFVLKTSKNAVTLTQDRAFRIGYSSGKHPTSGRCPNHWSPRIKYWPGNIEFFLEENYKTHVNLDASLILAWKVSAFNKLRNICSISTF